MIDPSDEQVRNFYNRLVERSLTGQPKIDVTVRTRDGHPVEIWDDGAVTAARRTVIKPPRAARRANGIRAARDIEYLVGSYDYADLHALCRVARDHWGRRWYNRPLYITQVMDDIARRRAARTP